MEKNYIKGRRKYWFNVQNLN